MILLKAYLYLKINVSKIFATYVSCEGYQKQGESKERIKIYIIYNFYEKNSFIFIFYFYLLTRMKLVIDNNTHPHFSNQQSLLWIQITFTFTRTHVTIISNISNISIFWNLPSHQQPFPCLTQMKKTTPYITSPFLLPYTGKNDLFPLNTITSTT